MLNRPLRLILGLDAHCSLRLNFTTYVFICLFSCYRTLGFVTVAFRRLEPYEAYIFLLIVSLLITRCG